MLKAIIFDLDETLLDWHGRSQSWEDYQWDHLGRVFDYVHKNIHPLPSFDLFYENTLAHVIAVWTDAKKTLIAPHLGRAIVDVLVEQGVPRHLLDIEDCLRAYAAEPIDGVHPFPEVVDELTVLKNRGLRLGVLTNSFQPMFMRDIELRAAGLLPFFEDGYRISAADVGFLKPHPQTFKTVLARMGVDAQEAVFVGDNLKADVAGAQAVGMKAVLRYNGNGIDQDSPTVPDGEIQTLSDLYSHLADWYPNWDHH